MEYIETTVTILLRKTLPFRDAQEQLGNFINLSMLQDNSLTDLHGKVGYKFYVYSGLWPIELSKTYLAGNVYIFRIRSLQADFLERLIPCMRKANSDIFKVLAMETKQFSRRHIQELYTLTPFVITLDAKPWMPDQHDFDILLKSLQGNAEKKYKTLFGEDIFASSFIKSIQILNEKPFAMHYKNITMLGHKAKIEVNEDESSQKLAFVVLGAGLAEKNASIGAGFCHGKFL